MVLGVTPEQLLTGKGIDDDYKEDSAIYLVTEHISRNFIRCCDGIKDVSENDK